MTRPVRQRKHDRLTYAGSPSRDELAIDMAIAPFDRAAREMDRKWGVDRLPELVSTELAAKFGRTLGSLNEAINANDLERATDRAAACIRGLEIMDHQARNHGHVPPDPAVIVQELADGFRFGLLVDERLWQIAEEQHPGLKIVSLREVAVLVRAAEENPLVAAVKEAFPGARISEGKRPKPKGPVPDDEVPF